MHTFADKDDTSWTVELTIGVIEEIKGKFEIDLLDPVGADCEVMKSLSPISSENIKLFCNMLYLLCEDQCKEKDVTSAQFGKLLGPTAIKGAYEAFFSEWEDFFQSLDRMDVVEAMTKLKVLLQEGITELVKEIKKLTLKDVREQTASLSIS